MKISRRRFLAAAGAAAAASVLTACGGSDHTSSSVAAAGDGKIGKVALTCDTGTIDDESFNQTSWEAIPAIWARTASTISRRQMLPMRIVRP